MILETSVIFNQLIQLIAREYFTEHFNYVGFEVHTTVVMKSSIFWDITACTPLKVKRRLRGTYLAYSSTPKMEATCSSEMAVDFQRTARRYRPKI
jgi:hypothetical protein